jgi:hypothetical protein
MKSKEPEDAELFLPDEYYLELGVCPPPRGPFPSGHYQWLNKHEYFHNDAKLTQIYFIAVSGEERYAVKVGRSSDSEARLRALQIAHYKPLVLLGYARLPRHYEWAIHNILRSAHIRGEWFKRTDLVDKLIDAVNTSDGSANVRRLIDDHRSNNTNKSAVLG